MEYDTVTRYVITHVNRDGLRVLTFACQGRDTYDNREQAEEALKMWRLPAGLPRVLSPGQLGTLEVRSVQCWRGHHDPTRTVFED